jgi:hypothetical protein
MTNPPGESPSRRLLEAIERVIYSVIVSCRRRQIDPWIYLRDLMRRLPAANHHEIPDLVPARWQPAS